MPEYCYYNLKMKCPYYDMCFLNDSSCLECIKDAKTLLKNNNYIIRKKKTIKSNKK